MFALRNVAGFPGTLLGVKYFRSKPLLWRHYRGFTSQYRPATDAHVRPRWDHGGTEMTLFSVRRRHVSGGKCGGLPLGTSAEVIRAQLEKILRSRAFAKSGRH